MQQEKNRHNKGKAQDNSVRRVAVTMNHSYQVSAAVAAMISLDSSNGQHSSRNKGENDEIIERIQELTEILNDKKNQFHSLSKDYATTQQDYQTKLSYLKELKVSSSAKIKEYVQTVTQTALKDSDFLYKESILQQKSELSNALVEEEYLTLHKLRYALEEALRIYGDCRKNLKLYQSKLSTVTSDARIDTLNIVAFSRYAQSVIATEIQKLPTTGISFSGQKVSDTKRINSSRCSKSAKEMKRLYVERIAKLRRDEMILTSRLAGAQSADGRGGYAVPDPQHHGSSGALPSNFRAPSPSPAVPLLKSALKQGVDGGGSNSTRAAVLTDDEDDNDEDDDVEDDKGGPATSFLPPLQQSPRPSTQTDGQHKPVNRKKKKTKMTKKVVAKGRQPASVGFDKEKFSSELFAASGVRIDDLTSSTTAPLHGNLHHHHPRPPNNHHHHGHSSNSNSKPEDRDGSHQHHLSLLCHTLRENTLLLRDDRVGENDRRLVQLASITCALEGKHRELFCVKEGLDEHLLKLSYVFLMLLQDLHEHLEFPSEPLRKSATNFSQDKSSVGSNDGRFFFHVDLGRDLPEMQRDIRESERLRAGLAYDTRLLLKLQNFSTII